MHKLQVFTKIRFWTGNSEGTASVSNGMMHRNECQILNSPSQSVMDNLADHTQTGFQSLLDLIELGNPCQTSYLWLSKSQSSNKMPQTTTTLPTTKTARLQQPNMPQSNQAHSLRWVGTLPLPLLSDGLRNHRLSSVSLHRAVFCALNMLSAKVEER